MLFAPALAEARGSPGTHPVGTIIGWGTYTLDKMPVPAGTLLFSGDVVITGDGSSAELSLVSGAIARIEAGSEVHLATVAGDPDLRQGALTLRTSAGKPVRSRLLGTPVVVGAASPAICRLEARSTSAVVAAVLGTVVIEASPARLVLAPGRIARLEGVRGQAANLSGSHVQPARVTAISAQTGSASSGPASTALPDDLRAAGRVVGSYPEAEVRHPDSPIAVPLRLGEIIDVGDVLGTLAGGRVRIQLLDNTIFDLGISTTLSVLHHDPDQHSTELDLPAGHLHADIGAPDGAQARFQVRTPIVEVSANPTMLFVSAEPKEAAVCSAGSGPVTVRGSNGGASVTLAAGQCSVTRAGEAAGPPHPDPARLQRQMELATFEGGPGIPELARSQALEQARTSTYAAVVVLDAVALIETEHAASAAEKVSPNFLTSAFNDLSNHAASAAEAARGLCLAFNSSFGPVPSPSIPVNECGSTAP